MIEDEQRVKNIEEYEEPKDEEVQIEPKDELVFKDEIAPDKVEDNHQVSVTQVSDVVITENDISFDNSKEDDFMEDWDD